MAVVVNIVVPFCVAPCCESYYPALLPLLGFVVLLQPVFLPVSPLLAMIVRICPTLSGGCFCSWFSFVICYYLLLVSVALLVALIVVLTVFVLCHI